jgi:putative Holliday junction resolvase
VARILALDLGLKRTGVAVTDPLRIIATALDTVATDQLPGFLANYFSREAVDTIVVGLPKRLDGSPTDMTPVALRWADELRARFPQKRVELVDERFTSKIAAQALIAMGAKKKDRQKKSNTDKVSATLILQTFLHTQ